MKHIEGLTLEEAVAVMDRRAEDDGAVYAMTMKRQNDGTYTVEIEE